MRTRPCPLPLPERLSPRLLNKAVGEMKAGAIPPLEGARCGARC
jgi:hypothetical protein